MNRRTLFVALVVMAGCAPAPAPSPATRAEMHLVVGDRVPLGALLRADASSAAYRSADSTVVAVVNGKELIAMRPGTAVVTGVNVPDTVRVVVVTQRHAVNEIINAVCPNENEKRLLSEEPVTSAVQRIHEYHDCQRLIQNHQYGALAGVFAHANVDKFQSWKDFVDGRLAAIVVSFVTKGQEMPYESLGLTGGVNCLVIRATGYDEWQAEIINQPFPVLSPAGPHYGDCADTLRWQDVRTKGVHALTVRVQHGVDMHGLPIAPPVARWDWDPVHQLNYIGVKCDSLTWCEIGPPGFAVSEAQLLPHTNRPIFKGYYDEQFLADSGGQTVSSVYGRIMPGEDTRDVHTMHHGTPRWYHASTVVFSERGPAPSHTFDKYSQWYSTTSAGIGPRRMIDSSALRLFPLPGSPLSGYRGRLNSLTLPDAQIVYHYHGGLIHVATVRWRWLYHDESTWSYCDPAGCCERQTDER